MAIQAIETCYAGYRFRSRLEARWAVFFDHMGIKWDYEPEGYLIGPFEDQKPYLPDFWLPSLNQWVEIKGSTLSLEEQLRVIHAAVTHPGWGLPNNSRGILLLGGIPEPRRDVMTWHHVFTFHKGDIYRSPFEWGAGNVWQNEWLIANCVDLGHFDISSQFVAGGPSVWNPQAWLVDPDPFGRSRNPGIASSGYQAARSARFEHGESG